MIVYRNTHQFWLMNVCSVNLDRPFSQGSSVFQIGVPRRVLKPTPQSHRHIFQAIRSLGVRSELESAILKRGLDQSGEFGAFFVSNVDQRCDELRHLTFRAV